MAYGNYRDDWGRERNERERMRDRDRGNQYTQSDDDDSRLARDSMERDSYADESGGSGRGGYGWRRGEQEEGERYNRGYGQGDYDQEYGEREPGQGARYGQSGRSSESGYGRGREGRGGERHYGNQMGGWQGREDEQWRNRDVHGQYDTDANYGGFSSSGTGNYRGYGGSGGSYQGGRGRWGEAGMQYSRSGGGASQGDYNYRGYERNRYGQGNYGQSGFERGRSGQEGSGQRYSQGSAQRYGSGPSSGGRAYGDYSGSPSGNFGEEYGSQGQGLDQYGSQGSQGRQWGQQDYGAHRGRGPRGYKRSDDRIREEVCDCLTDDDRLDATHIEVMVKDGEVTLSGFTTSRADKRWAESLAERIAGVKEVQNGIRLLDPQRDQSNQASTQSTQSSTQGQGGSAGSTGSSGTRGAGDNKGKESNIQH
jgi:osmotically-inducible protein OsmY